MTTDDTKYYLVCSTLTHVVMNSHTWTDVLQQVVMDTVKEKKQSLLSTASV